MSRTLRIGVQLLLLLGALTLSYFNWSSINDPVNFNNERDIKYIEVIKNMREIRDAQIAYRDYHNRYAPTWDDLISFIDTGKYVILDKKDIKVMKTQRGLTYEGTETRIDTLDIVPLKDSIFRKYKNSSKNQINELRYIPGISEKKEFDFKSTLDETYDSLNERATKTIRFEISAPKRIILNNLENKYDDLYIEQELNAKKGIKDSTLKIGSLRVNSTDGNWPKSYDIMVDNKYHINK